MTFWPGFEEEEKNRMLLSQATLVGILMTMLSVILRTVLYHPFALKHVFLELIQLSQVS